MKQPEEEEDDKYLLRWITGSLTDVERSKLKNRDDYEDMEGHVQTNSGRKEPNTFKGGVSPLLWVAIIIAAILFYYFVF